jgi:hypothetical protein
MVSGRVGTIVGAINLASVALCRAYRRERHGQRAGISQGTRARLGTLFPRHRCVQYHRLCCLSEACNAFRRSMLSFTPQPFFSSAPTSSRCNPMVSGYISHIATQPIAQMAAYTPKVHDGVSNSIIGKKVSPTMKLQPQLVAVEMDDPRDRTLRGNNSDCCPVRHGISYLVRVIQNENLHGTEPIPVA